MIEYTKNKTCLETTVLESIKRSKSEDEYCGGSLHNPNWSSDRLCDQRVDVEDEALFEVADMYDENRANVIDIDFAGGGNG